MPSAARFLAPTKHAAAFTISRPTETVCATRSSTPKACALRPALWKLDARWPLAPGSNALACIGPFAAPTPSSLSAVPSLVVAFRTSGNAERNGEPHDSSLSCRALSFEREFRKVSRRNSTLLDALEELIALLAKDPHGCSGQHPIKKLEGVKPGEGQWRVRWGEYRLRGDLFGCEVVLHSFRRRKDAY